MRKYSLACYVHVVWEVKNPFFCKVVVVDPGDLVTITA